MFVISVFWLPFKENFSVFRQLLKFQLTYFLYGVKYQAMKSLLVLFLIPVFMVMTWTPLVFSSPAGEILKEGAFVGTFCEAEYISPNWFDGAFDVEMWPAPVSLAGKWGYINSKGEWDIEPRFEATHVFSATGMAPAVLNNQTGYINRKGEWVIPPQFDTGSVFTVSGLALVVREGKYGLIDIKGNWITVPNFDEIRFSVKQGLIYLTGPALIKRGDAWSVVNLPQGAPIVDLLIDKAKHFSEGLAAVETDGKWGYVNSKGEWAVPPRFDTADDFSHGLALISVNGKYGFIDDVGNLAILPQFEFAHGFYNKDQAKVVWEGKWGVIDRNGEWVISPQFDEIHGGFPSGEPVAAAQENRWGYVNSKGKWIIPPRFDTAFSFSEGLGRVETDGKWGLINSEGSYVIPPKFDFIGHSSPSNKGFRRVVIGEKYNFIRNPDPASCPQTISR